MVIMESAIAMNNDYVECTNTLGKLCLFAEAAYTEYKINLKEVALKVLKENGTEDDFDFLATEAANGYIERAKNAIVKIIEAVKKFINNCKENLTRMVTNAKTKAAIEKVEDTCKSNTKLRSHKVKYQDTDKHVGVIQQGIDRLRKKVSKVKAKGVATQNDIKDIEEIESDTMKKVAAISVISVVTLGTAIAIFKHCNSKSEVDDDIYLGDSDFCDLDRMDEETTKTSETASFYTKAAGLIAKLKKEKAAKKVTKSTSLLAAIKKAISEISGKAKSENLEGQTHESTLEELTMFSYIEESASETDDGSETSDTETVEIESVGMEEGLDLDQYFTEMCDELFNHTDTNDTSETDVTESTSDSEETSEDNGIDMAVTYMEQLERELFGENEEVTTESEEETPVDEPVGDSIVGDNVNDTIEDLATESTDGIESTVESLLNEMESLVL